MKRLEYNIKTQEMLEAGTKIESWYWRYQDAKHAGIIPVAHQSHERIFSSEEPECIEEGCSCYDNPYQLMQYLNDENNDLDDTDVVLFVGEHKGCGLDEEDIVAVEDENDVYYSMSLRTFYKFCLNADMYWNAYCIKEYLESKTEEWKVSVLSK